MERSVNVLDASVKACLALFVVFSMFSISVTQISCALGGLAWLTKVHLTHSWNKVKLPLGLPILLFVLACILAVITAVDPGNSYKSLKKLLQLLIFFWAVNNIKDDRQREFLVLLLIVAGCVAALNGIYQGWKDGVTVNTRVEGTMSMYMTFAGLLMLVGLLAIGRFLFNPANEKWLIGAAILLSICLLMTLTRQAWLGFFAGLAFLVYFWRRVFLLSIPVFIFLILIFSPAPVKDRIQSLIDMRDDSLDIRLSLWRGGLTIFKDHPLTGCGFKCVDIVHRQYPDPDGYLGRFKGMHNNFIQLLVDTGILGLGAWISIWVMYFFSLRRNFNPSNLDTGSRWTSITGAAAVIGFHVGGLFEVNFYDSEVIMLLYFIMALPFTYPQPENPVK